MEKLTFEGLPGTFQVVDAGQYVSVTWMGPDRFRQNGVASADFHDWKDYWWVSRVVVKDPASRSKGIGSKLVQLLLEAIKKKGQGKRVVVAPGGYGSDPEKQFAFYRRQGFSNNGSNEEVLECLP